ncbi:MAG: hypothetical protein ABEL76_16435 [Bradymonadaceae bacterium]
MNTENFLKSNLDASEREIPRLVDMAVEALREETDYESEEESSDQLWRYLQYPYYLGLFAQRVVAAVGISPEVKEKLSRAVLQVNNRLEKGQEPGPGFFQLTAWLGENGRLTREDYLGLRRGIIWLPRLTDNYREDIDYVLPACEGVFRDTDITYQESVELILMILTAKEAIGDHGREIFDFILSLDTISDELKREVCDIVVEKAIPFPRGEFDHPQPTNDEERDRLSIRFQPGSVRRRAVVWLAKLGRDPLQLLDDLLKPNTVRGYGGDHVASGALDLLSLKWDDLDEGTRMDLLEKAADLPDTSVRKRAYILGEKNLGLDFLEQSLDDKAKSLRHWARERLQEREEEPHPTEEELQEELETPLEE